jgi:hypothetical protein
MAAHPDWAGYWELADDPGDAELVTEEAGSRRSLGLRSKRLSRA